MAHPTEEELIAFHDEERSPRERRSPDRPLVSEHLKACAQCRAELERIEAVFSALDALPVPDPGEDYGRRVWQQIAGRLPEKRAHWGFGGGAWGLYLQSLTKNLYLQTPDRKWWTGLFAPRRLAAFGAVAAMVIAAFLAGRFIPPKPNPPVEQADEAKTRERVLWLAVGEHLGRSEMMLVELANTEPKIIGAKHVDISPEQRRAEDLLDENRLYRQTALQQGDNALVGVLDELERILLDVAHSPDAVTPAQLHSIQQRIDKQGILFKVRVVRQQLRERREANPVRPRNNSAILERNKA